MRWRSRSTPLGGGRLLAGVLPILAVFPAVLVPGNSRAQALFGDPSSTLGGLGRFSIEVGGSLTPNQDFRFDGMSVPMVLTSQTFTLVVPDYTDGSEGEQVFVTATVGLAQLLDVYGTVGLARIEGDGFSGERALAGGGGIRVTPRQDGPVRVGLQLQAFRASGEDDTISGVVSSLDALPGSLDQVSVHAPGSGREKISLTRYDALLGFGVHSLPYVRPYGGVLFTVVDGTDTGSLAGQAYYVSCPRAGGVCTTGEEPYRLSARNGFGSDKALGAVAGASVEASPQWALTLEGRFLSQTTYGAAVRFRF